MQCGSDANTCHDHKQTMVSVKCQQTHQQFGQVYNVVQQLNKKTEESVALYKPILGWAAEGAKTADASSTPSNQRNLENDYKLIKAVNAEASEIMEKFDNFLANYKIEEMLKFEPDIQNLMKAAQETAFMMKLDQKIIFDNYSHVF